MFQGMRYRPEVSTILANLALRRFPVVLEDEERHPELINARGVHPYAVIRPAGWLYLCLLKPLRFRFEPDRATAIPLQ